MKIWHFNGTVHLRLSIRPEGNMDVCLLPNGHVREYPARGVLSFEDLTVLAGGTYEVSRTSDTVVLSTTELAPGPGVAHCHLVRLTRLLRAGFVTEDPIYDDDGNIDEGWEEVDIRL